ncbi:MAG: translation elongation factor Ts [Deltaproteobacteria bacterium]|nr:translation elongation factor Ts [Deltaproteobacteria bacterium]MCB9787412.1 translation elongation factor Ts [Deltaproteobacteria bacterium]
MTISASTVKELRERTGAGMMDCKKALQESNGDIDAAAEYLQKKQLASVDKKAGRIATEGVVGSYIHMGGRIGVLVEINCETDFVARNEAFQTFVKDITMHIAAAAPTVVSVEELPADVLAKQREIFIAQAIEEGKPPAIAEKMVEGRVKKWERGQALLEQPFVKDPDKTVRDLVAEITAGIGEKISIRRFVRFEVGEGLEKKVDNFAAEVAAQAGL